MMMNSRSIFIPQLHQTIRNVQAAKNPVYGVRYIHTYLRLQPPPVGDDVHNIGNTMPVTCLEGHADMEIYGQLCRVENVVILMSKRT